MLKIKLSPTGKKHARLYRIVVMEENSKITGTATDSIGTYDPKTKAVTLDKAAAASWMKKGAQPTATVAKLIEAK